MKLILFLLPFCFFLGACSEVVNDEAAINDKERSEKLNIVPPKVSVEFAQNFLIKSITGGYEVSLIDPNSHEVEAIYILTYDHSKKGDRVIHIPVKNVAALSQTTVGMFSKLDALASISGISKMDYVYSPVLKSRFNKGNLYEFGDESNLPLEKIIQSKSDLIIYSGFGTELDASGKLKKLGIQSIPNYEWRETHPLGRAEWIKFLGILVDKSEEASKVFNRVKSNYEDLRWKIRNNDNSPKVISGNVYADQWTTPAGNSYMAILIRDAGANYTYGSTTGTGSLFLPIEKVILDNRATRYWINPGIRSKHVLMEMNPKAHLLDAYKDGIYCYSHAMNHYWEMTAIEPDVLLGDLIHIFHPAIEPKRKLHFYKKIED